MRWSRRHEPEPPPWVVLMHAAHQPEADLVVNMLNQEGVPAYHKRAMGFDVPDFLALGARVVLVRADHLARARELVDPFDWERAPGEPAP